MIHILKSKTVRYLAAKYLTFAFQFFLVIFAAKILGVLSFAIYAFIKLLSQYFAFTNCGVNYAFNVLGVTDGVKSKKELTSLLSNAVAITIFFGIVSLIIFAASLQAEIFSEKFKLKDYLLPISVFFITKLINTLLSGYARILNRLDLLSYYNLIPVVLEILALAFFHDTFYILEILVWSMALGHSIVFAMFIYFECVELRFADLEKIKIIKLIKRGKSLLLYNIGVGFLFIATKTFIAARDSTANFASFSLASNLIEGISLLIGSVGFLLYPKLLNYFALKNKQKAHAYINRNGRRFSVSLSFLFTAFLGVILISKTYLTHIYEDFDLFIEIIFGLGLSSYLLADTLIFSAFLTQQKQESVLIKYCLSSLGILGLFFGANLIAHYDILVISLAGLGISCIVFNILLRQKTKQLLGSKASFTARDLSANMNLIVSFPLYVYYFYFLLGLEASGLFGLVLVILFIIVNFKTLNEAKTLVFKIIFDEKILKISRS